MYLRVQYPVHSRRSTKKNLAPSPTPVLEVLEARALCILKKHELHH